MRAVSEAMTSSTNQGRANTNAGALFRNPVGPAIQQVDEVQVAAIQLDGTIAELLVSQPQQVREVDIREEQKKDTYVLQIIRFFEDGELPHKEKLARKLALQAPMFAVTDGIILYYVETKGSVRRTVLPRHLQQQLVEESHGGRYAGHFCGPKVYSMLAKHWWWEGMYTQMSCSSASPAQNAPLLPRMHHCDWWRSSS